MKKKIIYGEELIDEWLRNKEVVVKKSTYSGYVSKIDKHIKPMIGALNLNEIVSNSNFFNDFILIKQKSLKMKSIRSLLIILKSMFDLAHDRKYIDLKPNIQIPKENDKDIVIFSEVEQSDLIHFVLTDIDSTGLSILIALFTGLRIGEICALHFDDIDLEEGYIKVSKTLQRIKNTGLGGNKTEIIIDTPKSRKSIRTMPIPEFLMSYLKKFLYPNCYLLSKTKRYVEPRTLENRYRKFLSEVGISYKNFHVLRHTYATNCIRLGMDVKTLSELLGHENVKITLEKYVHTDLERKRQEVCKLNNAFYEIEKHSDCNAFMA